MHVYAHHPSSIIIISWTYSVCLFALCGLSFHCSVIISSLNSPDRICLVKDLKGKGYLYSKYSGWISSPRPRVLNFFILVLTLPSRTVQAFCPEPMCLCCPEASFCPKQIFDLSWDWAELGVRRTFMAIFIYILLFFSDTTKKSEKKVFLFLFTSLLLLFSFITWAFLRPCSELPKYFMLQFGWKWLVFGPEKFKGKKIEGKYIKNLRGSTKIFFYLVVYIKAEKKEEV